MSLDVTLRVAIFWVAAVLCVVAELAILRSMRRATRAGVRPPGETTDATVPRGQPVMETIWAVAPPIVLVLVLILTRDAIR